MQPQTYPGRGLSKTSLVLSAGLFLWMGILTVVSLAVGGPARFVALLTSLGMVATIGVLVYRAASRGGSLKITPELVAFRGERIFLRDIESVERGAPDRANQTFRVEVRTRDRVHRVDLMDYRIDPAAMPGIVEALQREVALGKGVSPGPLTPPPGAPASPGPRSP